MNQLSPLSTYLLQAIASQSSPESSGKIHINQLVAKMASLYEKLRNAMEYREEAVVLRATIERIIKRRLLLGGTGMTIAEPLVRELLWARYFPEQTITEEKIQVIGKKIDVYIRLRQEIVARKMLGEHEVNEWINHLLSSDIEQYVNASFHKNLVAGFMFQIMKSNILIGDDSEQTRDVQVFIAIRKTFAKDDIAFLRYHLFLQYFGEVKEDNVLEIGALFYNGYQEIQKQLTYPLKDRIASYVNNKTPIFFVLEDLLQVHGAGFADILKDSEESLSKAVLQACSARYSGIRQKVGRAIFRSVIFILLTKAFFAFAIEGSIENVLYGGIDIRTMLVNVAVPPILMIMVGFNIRIPGKRNSELIFQLLKEVMFQEKPDMGMPLEVLLMPKKGNPFLHGVFTLLWFLAFMLTFGAMVFVLSKANFNIISQGIFIFFLTIVSFLSYRIWLMSREYSVEKKPGLISPLTDFFFMPIIRVGRSLTEGIAQINILLFVFDFIIETPFKGLFAFFEQWFFFLHAKREELE